MKPIRRNSQSNYTIFLVVLGFFLAMAGCTAEPEPPVITPKKIVKREAPRESRKTIPEIQTKEEAGKEEIKLSYYKPKGKRDPFKPFISMTPLDKSKKRGPRLTPLQKYKLSQLKLVGIIWGISRSVAMVEDSTSKGFILKRGTLVGENNGRVVRITKDRVIVQQKRIGSFGTEVKKVRVTLKLHKSEEGEAL